MSRTLKETLTKLVLETGENWNKRFSFALFDIFLTRKGSFLLKLCLGDHFPSSPNSKIFPRQNSHHILLKSLQALQEALQSFSWTVEGALASPFPNPPTSFSQETWLDKEDPTRTLETAWKGPYPVILTTPTAVKMGGIIPWILHSQLKKTAKDKDR